MERKIPISKLNLQALPRQLYFSKRLVQLMIGVLIVPYFAIELLGNVTQQTRYQQGVEHSRYLGVFAVVAAVGIVGALIISLGNQYLGVFLTVRRIRRFAAANDLKVLGTDELLPLLPAIISRGVATKQKAIGCTIQVRGGAVTVFDYIRVEGSGRDRKVMQYSFACLQVKQSYPHMYLDNKRNGKNRAYASRQRVALEGDFANYFDLYIPQGSQAGSLTVFAPDFMQVLLDYDRQYDMEIQGHDVAIISDDSLFTRHKLPATLQLASKVASELKQLGRSWQPVLTHDQKPFVLRPDVVPQLVVSLGIPIIIVIALRIAHHYLR